LSIYSDPKRISSFTNRFYDAITLLEDKREVISFLKDLLTPTEIRMIAKRLQIADMLSKGYKYQDIKNFVRVTVQTISSMSNKLQFGNDGLINILKKLVKIEEQHQAKLERKFNPFSQPPGLSRAMTNLAGAEISKIIRRHKKVSSVKRKIQ
ncbi:hypothetical protein HYS91_00005, partial [Candidatus Daviesbacteria bacterium]|nr:hypothetical protein [Candidatus Daviesbacteria bacterium]